MNCRGDHGIDAKRSRPSIGKTRDVPREQRTRANVWDPISGLHQGQRPQRLHQQAEYMAAPERFAEMPDFFPCTAGAVHTWHKAAIRCLLFGRFRGQSGHQPATSAGEGDDDLTGGSLARCRLRIRPSCRSRLLLSDARRHARSSKRNALRHRSPPPRRADRQRLPASATFENRWRSQREFALVPEIETARLADGGLELPVEPVARLPVARPGPHCPSARDGAINARCVQVQRCGACLVGTTHRCLCGLRRHPVHRPDHATSDSAMVEAPATNEADYKRLSANLIPSATSS